MAPARIEYPPDLSPAWHIPLSDDQLRTLGELCAIQGQIEWLMQLTVSVQRGISLPKARKLLGSPNLSANAHIWLQTIEKATSRRDIKELAQAIVKEIDALRQGRNDFVHAVFAYGVENDDEAFFMTRNPEGEQPAVAVHNLKAKPVANLKITRDKAAALSRFIDHVYMRTSGIPGTEPTLPDIPAP
jgi:hypothetical protein